jgi:DNA-binding GntR family transcriptional regulator
LSESLHKSKVATLDPGALDDPNSRGPNRTEDEIYDLLTRAIITKQIRPGGRIREAVLAAEFGVSRARVRRVLQRLADLDVVEFRLNFGALVSRPSPEESRAVFHTRRVLEAEAVRAAVQRNNPAKLLVLQRLVEREAEAFESAVPGLTAISSGFHIAIGEMCGNSVLAKMLNQLIHRCVLIQTLYERPNQKTICLVGEHARIVSLMMQKNVADAVAEMERHLHHIEESLDYSGAPLDRRLAASLG